MIRRRVDTTTTKTGNERWLVSYSDLVTLLFAFFVVMYSVSQVNSEKYRVLSATLAETFQGKVPVDAQVKVQLDRLAVDRAGAASSSKAVPTDTLAIAELLHAQLQGKVAVADMRISASEEWVEIDLNANLLFSSASAEPSAEARQIFADVAVALAPLPNFVEVAGHTDAQPIETSQYASNWELSSARATAVVRLLAQGGVHPQRLAAVGYGEFRPTADNNTADGRAQNRRVVLKVARHSGVAPTTVGLQSIATSATTTAATAEELPAEKQPSPTPESPQNQDIAPVRLDNGNLLFSSDPELPRQPLP